MYKYTKIKFRDGTTKDLHRIVMENYLGRPMDRSEVVHHIDGDGRNNRLENLELMLIGRHASHHHKDVPRPERRGWKGTHGRTGYDWGCRCDTCVSAKKAHNLSRYNPGNCRNI